MPIFQNYQIDLNQNSYEIVYNYSNFRILKHFLEVFIFIIFTIILTHVWIRSIIKQNWKVSSWRKQSAMNLTMNYNLLCFFFMFHSHQFTSDWTINFTIRSCWKLLLLDDQWLIYELVLAASQMQINNECIRICKILKFTSELVVTRIRFKGRFVLRYVWMPPSVVKNPLQN